MQRLFTLEEAETLLPRLVPILEAIRRAQGEVSSIEERIGALLARVRGNGHGVDVSAVEEARADLQRQTEELRQRMAELDELGVELKDPSTGLIDFPSEREGRVVYLCWRLGEPRIDWWHEVDAGFVGRQPLHRGG